MSEHSLLVYKDTARRDENPGIVVRSKRSCIWAAGHGRKLLPCSCLQVNPCLPSIETGRPVRPVEFRTENTPIQPIHTNHSAEMFAGNVHQASSGPTGPYNDTNGSFPAPSFPFPWPISAPQNLNTQSLTKATTAIVYSQPEKRKSRKRHEA